MSNRLAFSWRHSQIVWRATTTDKMIIVDDPLYERILHEQLAAQGIEWKTFDELMRPGREAWERQCEAVDQIQGNLEFWKSIPEVEVHPLKSR